jgi:hypothetical protein
MNDKFPVAALTRDGRVCRNAADGVALGQRPRNIRYAGFADSSTQS